jgi:hypothetical protein
MLTAGQAQAAGLTPQQIAIDRAATQEPAAVAAAQGQGITGGTPNVVPPQPIRTAQAQPQLLEPEADPQVVAMRRRIQVLMSQANEQAHLGALVPAASKAAENLMGQARILQDQADKRVERLTKEREMQLGVTLAGPKKQAEADVEQYSNLHKGLAGAGMTAANSLQYSQIAKGLIEDPQFRSGSGEQLSLAYKRALSALGIDPGAALPQEAFRKVMAANINQQINSLRAESEAMGEKGGRIFAPMITLMEKAAQNPENSVAANRYLTELALRGAQRTMTIADMADNYKAEHGGLDAGFERELRTWIAKNPVFTKEEMANPELIGTPPKAGAAPQAGEGATATNPKTGEKLIRQNGKWVPLT